MPVPDDGYSNAYAIQHPVRSRYDRLLGALGDAAKSRMMMRGQVIRPGDEGKEEIRIEREALMDASILEGELACYFKEEDFESVYPHFTQETLFSDIGVEKLSLNLLELRRAKIKAICEKEKWFELPIGEIIPTSERRATQQPPMKGLPTTLARS